MPSILQKHQLTRGKAIVQFGSGTSKGGYFYRELIPNSRNYLTRKLEGCNNMEEAISMAFEITANIDRSSFPTTDANKRGDTKKLKTKKDKTFTLIRQKRVLIVDTIYGFIESEEKRALHKVIKPVSVYNKKRLLTLHLIPYLKNKGVEYVDQIDLSTFQDFTSYRSIKDTPKLLLAKEVKFVKDWVVNYLLINKLIDPYLANEKKLFPRVDVRPDDLLKNPAVMPIDWLTIIKFIRTEWRQNKKKGFNYRAAYTADVFWHFILLAKNTGMDREELMKLKWKNIETIDVGRTNSKGEREEWLVTYIYTTRSKTGVSREIPCNQGRELRRLLKIQRGYIKRYGLNATITPDTLVFGNVFENMKPYFMGYFHHIWRYQIFKPLKEAGLLLGHKFSPHDYTLKSLRATFIEDKLRAGTDIFLLARVAGHDPKVLMRHYENLDIRERSNELTIDTSLFGKREETTSIKVNLLNENNKDKGNSH